MEIYLEFAENKAIEAKRQGQQEESTLERIQTQKLHGKSREDICSALREKFGEKNPEMQVLN